MKRGLEMAFYQVEGTSLISWSLFVEGKNECEASAAAVRIAGGLSDLRRDHALRDARHQVVSSRRLIETPTRDRAQRQPAAPMGDE